MRLSPDQLAAVRAYREHSSPHASSRTHASPRLHFSPALPPPFLLTGNAGMGKTSLIAHLGLPKDTLYLAESNKAVAVLRSKLPATAMTATVCSAAYRFNRDKQAQIDLIDEKLAAPNLSVLDRHMLLGERRAAAEADDRLPRDHYFHPQLPTDQRPSLVVLDEASMVNATTRRHLESLGVPMLAIGDWAQLPPVDGEPGYDFRNRASATLTTQHRTDVPALVRMWDRARALVTDPLGDPLPKHGWLSDRDTVRSLLSADVVVTGRRVTHAALTYAIRALTKRPLHRPVPGDVLMASANGEGVTKGDFRTVARVRPTTLRSRERSTRCYQITFTDGSVHLVGTYGFYRQPLRPEQIDAYAPRLIDIPTIYDAKRRNPAPQQSLLTAWEFGQVITGHKAQGSQWPRVAVIDESMCWAKDDQHGNWIYTAVSRASHSVKIYGPPRRGSDILSQVFHLA